VIVRALLIATLVVCVMGEEAQVAKGSSISFTSNVAKMLDILINSLYTNRNIFLREIISNASDALDKIRFLYLTNPKDPKTDSGETPEMDIRIRLDNARRAFIMRDGGIGMTKNELAEHLGSLGTSGTKGFLEKLKETNDANLIGQFGVGFYSVFLVADKVLVASKSDESDKQWVWESAGNGEFFLYEDPRGNTLGRGTELTLELKKDADEFLDADKVKETIHRYSEFIHFPIYIETKTTEKVPKAAVEAEGEEKPEGDAHEEEEEEVTKVSWKLVNENKPIWTRSPKELKEEDYNKFYKALTKDYDNPMYFTHFSAEGEVEFKALLFIPARMPYNALDNTQLQSNIRLYVRRVFITDEFKDLLPRYLNFIRGVVDSDDLPLNVSREVLQESRILKIIKKKLVRKALGMLQDVAEHDKKLEADKKEAKEDAEEEAAPAGGKKLTEVLYPKVWEEFGKSLRLGLIEDGSNRARLTKLLRYKSSKSEDAYTSLEDYVERMPKGQKAIYFIAGESIEKIKQAPVLEDAIRRDVEVLYMTDAIDEYVVHHVTDFAGHKLSNLNKENIKFEDTTKKDKAIEAKRKERFEPLIHFLKELFSAEKLAKVVLTKRRTSEPFILSSPQHGVSANMQRIMKWQALGQERQSDDAKRVLEVNPLHPLVDEVFKRVQVDPADKVAEDIAYVLYDVAALQNGFDVQDAQLLSRRVNRILRQSVDIAADAPMLEEDMNAYAAAVEEEETEKAADAAGAEAEVPMAEDASATTD